MEYSTDILSWKQCPKASTEDYNSSTGKLLKYALTRNEIVRREIHKTSFNSQQKTLKRIKVSVFMVEAGGSKD